ncbi:hypothetical protein MNB_SV-6-1844 [hydrothermal vent metagenome]|uniref:Pyrrolo-quinoline quinone repeat domain-containing protein n=1 Tax=hydrothermal vent metagenome TaxID=652676 RepID=A0A1W1C3Q4_9ZZZZ
MMNKFFLLATASLLMFGTIVVARESKRETKEPTFEKVWQKTYGDTDTDIAKGVVALEGGDVAVVGDCKSFGAKQTDICVTRVNAKGKTIWRKMLGGKNLDEASAITRAKDGSILVVGTSRSFSKKRDRDIYVAKISLDGKGIWQNTFGRDRAEYGRAIAGTDDGGAIVVGETESFGNGYRDIFVVKINKDGNMVTEQKIGGEKNDLIGGMTRTRDGDLVVVGSREIDRVGDSDFFVMKIDQNGKKIWARTYGGEYEDVLNAVTPTLDGGIVAAGYTRSYGSAQTDLTVMNFNADGKLIWHKIYGYKRYDFANAITMSRDGDFLIAGGTDSMGEGVYDMYIIALDRAGNLFWSALYGGRNTDIAHGITRASDGSIVVVGESDSYTNAKDFFMIKLKKVVK